MPTAHVNGVDLFYQITGDSQERLVLVHGSWGDHHNWDRVVPALAGTFRVLTYDRRGHSLSQRVKAQGSVHEDVADLGVLIEQVGFAPAHIAGNSYGAAIVLRLSGQRPDLFRSLIVHEPPLLAVLADDPAAQEMQQDFLAREQAVRQRLIQGDMAAGARLFVDTLAFGPGVWETLPVPVQQTFIANAPTWLDESNDPDALSIDLAALSRFTPPALLTQGDHSPAFFAPILAKIATALPQAERVTIVGAGHVPHMSHPSDYARLVTSFISSVQRASEWQRNA